MSTIRFFLFYVVLNVFCVSVSQAQRDDFETLEKLEIQLSELRKAILSAQTDIQRIAINNEFSSMLEHSLQTSGSFTFTFSKIEKIGNIYSKDNLLRIICWNIPLEDNTHQYHAYVLHRKSVKDVDAQVFKLYDKRNLIDRIEYKTLNADQWHGALYYNIVDVKDNDGTYYTLLGWDGNDGRSHKKIIDILYFDTNQKLKFGKEVFDNLPRQKRVIFEYNAEAIMSVRYHEKSKRIIYDHLMPMEPNMEGLYDFYVPDLSFDAYELKKGKWKYIADVDARGKQTMEKYNSPNN